jgi:hypothetical protein
MEPWKKENADMARNGKTARFVVRQFWVVGTPRRGVRSAQRADPTNSFSPITDAFPRRPRDRRAQLNTGSRTRPLIIQYSIYLVCFMIPSLQTCLFPPVMTIFNHS